MKSRLQVRAIMRARIQGIDWKDGRETFRIISDVDWSGAEPAEARSAEDEDPFAFAAPQRLPGIVIGVEMARNLNLRVGETLRLVSPILTTVTPVGSAPKSQGFEVVGLFHSKMYEYDAHFAFVDIEDARISLKLRRAASTRCRFARLTWKWCLAYSRGCGSASTPTPGDFWIGERGIRHSSLLFSLSGLPR